MGAKTSRSLNQLQSGSFSGKSPTPRSGIHVCAKACSRTRKQWYRLYITYRCVKWTFSPTSDRSGEFVMSSELDKNMTVFTSHSTIICVYYSIKWQHCMVYVSAGSTHREKRWRTTWTARLRVSSTAWRNRMALLTRPWRSWRCSTTSCQRCASENSKGALHV